MLGLQKKVLQMENFNNFSKSIFENVYRPKVFKQLGVVKLNMQEI